MKYYQNGGLSSKFTRTLLLNMFHNVPVEVLAHPIQTWGIIIAVRVLATYLIPGCVGRGVRLGSENSSGGGVWKSGNLEIWEFGNLETWKSGNF